jgi:ribonuclease-3
MTMHGPAIGSVASGGTPMSEAGAALDDAVVQAEAILHHTFADRALASLALTHASSADHRLVSNERLEFLGDAVLGIIVCEHIFREHPALEEGELTKIKSSVVSRDTCARVARALGMDRLIRVGKGMSDRGDVPTSLAAGVGRRAALCPGLHGA